MSNAYYNVHGKVVPASQAFTQSRRGPMPTNGLVGARAGFSRRLVRQSIGTKTILRVVRS
jgi:hypothetical protein